MVHIFSDWIYCEYDIYSNYYSKAIPLKKIVVCPDHTNFGWVVKSKENMSDEMPKF